MSADLLHEGHYQLLAMCRARCSRLIVGLVSDLLFVKQKRVPIQSFAQRRTALIHCKYVDDVVDHNGEPKAVAWDKLRFDILFSSDEYYGSPEFEAFKIACPDIPIIYIPRPLHQPYSTSKIIFDLMVRMQASTEILAVGFTGNIVRQGFDPFFVSKPIHFALEETLGQTNDSFGFYHHPELPRNWKSKNHCADEKKPPPFPMIAGVHSNRELVINRRLKHKPWCTYVDHKVIYTRDPKEERTPVHGSRFPTLLEFANAVADARRYPHQIVHLIQRDGGQTFEKWCLTTCQSKEEFQTITSKIEEIILELQAEGIVHGDIHPRNVLIDKKGQVSIIDFGWVMSREFQMCEKEKAQLEHELAHHFDQTHFHNSMLVCEATLRWFDVQS